MDTFSLGNPASSKTFARMSGGMLLVCLSVAALELVTPVAAAAATLSGVTVTYTSSNNRFSETLTFSDGSTTTTTGAGQSVDISAALAANVPIVLNNIKASVLLTVPSTEYDSVISGTGTVEVSQNINPSAAIGTGATLVTSTSNAATNPVANGATLIITGVQTLTLPLSEATESTANQVVSNPNPPVLTVDPGVTINFTNNGTTSANFFWGDSTGQINLANILNNGTLLYNGLGAGPLIGLVSGAGGVASPALFFHGPHSMSGVLSNQVQMFFGSSIMATSLPNVSAILNDGSLLVSSPPKSPLRIPQNIYESRYGSDINTDGGLNIFTGVDSNSNNTSLQRPNLTDPGLVDCTKSGTPFTGTIGVTGDPSEFNTMSLQYSGLNYTNLNHFDANSCQDSAIDDGGNSSFRGINIEGGITQWGDGTTNNFFLPATPDNSYINLHSNATLAIDYSGSTGPVTLNVPIGGGQIGNSLTATGNGTVHIINPNGGKASVVFTQPMYYNGPTVIDAGATLQLGAGKQMVTYFQGINLAGDVLVYNPATVYSTYSGDSLLLISQTAPGNANDSITLNGTLIVNNTENPITLSNISGTGQVVQTSQPNAAAISGVPDTKAAGQATLLSFLPGSTHPSIPTLTLTGNNTFTGGTTVTANSTLIVDGGSALGGNGSAVSNQGILKATSATGIIKVPGNYSQTPLKAASTNVKANPFNHALTQLGKVQIDGSTRFTFPIEIASAIFNNEVGLEAAELDVRNVAPTHFVGQIFLGHDAFQRRLRKIGVEVNPSIS